MSLLDRFREWCAQPLLEAERMRCYALVVAHGERCKAAAEQQWQQAFAEGQHCEHIRVFEMVEQYVADRDGEDVGTEDSERARNYYRQ